MRNISLRNYSLAENETTHNENKYLIRPAYDLEYTILRTHLTLPPHFNKNVKEILLKSIHASSSSSSPSQRMMTVKNQYRVSHMNKTQNGDIFFYIAVTSIAAYANECDKNAQHASTCM